MMGNSPQQGMAQLERLTFTNPNELKIKVVCDSWTISYTNKAFYNIQANFRRVFEP